jgi:multidrug efflux pump subunit AcrA (membrane-fusion protein)
MAITNKRFSLPNCAKSTDAHRRAEALFKKEQQSHEAQQAMTEYEAELQAMREKTARLRALRLARDAVNQKMRTAPIRRGHIRAGVTVAASWTK